MKISKLSRFVVMATVVVATSGLYLMPSTALARDPFVQQKGSERLMKIETAGDLQKVEVGDTIIMSCPKCKDTYATVVDKTLKGQIKDEKTTVLHLCPTCTTKIEFTGLGKQSTDKVIHTCSNCGSTDVSCCVLKKNGGTGTTSGMEKMK